MKKKVRKRESANGNTYSDISLTSLNNAHHLISHNLKKLFSK